MSVTSGTTSPVVVGISVVEDADIGVHVGVSIYVVKGREVVIISLTSKVVPGESVPGSVSVGTSCVVKGDIAAVAVFAV